MIEKKLKKIKPYISRLKTALPSEILEFLATCVILLLALLSPPLRCLVITPTWNGRSRWFQTTRRLVASRWL